jgi:membrane-associated phospholipid phosphatase
VLAAALLGVLVLVLALGVRDGGTYSWDRGPVEFFDEHYYDMGPLRTLTKAAVKASIGFGILFAAALLAVLAAARTARRAVFWASTVFGALVLSRVLKELIERPEIGVHGREYSFPSGNATVSVAGLVGLLLLLPPSRLRRILAIAGAVVIPLYGVALVLLLWHYPSDVVAGWALGLAWVLILRAALGEVSGPISLGPFGRHPIWRSAKGTR